MRVIESMPVKSLLTFPQSGISHDFRQRLTVRGHAWAGDRQISAVFLSSDFGTTWLPTALRPVANRLAWQHWQSWVQFPEPGYYEIWARAMDERGRSQPMVVPGWNPRGYLNNACHRIAVQAVLMTWQLRYTSRLSTTALLLALVLLAYYNPTLAQELDRGTGLVLEDGWELVQENCTECHSAQLITQNSGSREVWKSRVTWMQQTYEFYELETAVEDAILNYLASNYGQKESARRAGLAVELLPDNPFGADQQDDQ